MAQQDDAQDPLDQVRVSVHGLHTEIQQKLEDLERARKHKQDTRDQLDALESALSEVENDLAVERSKAAKESVDSHHNLEEAAKLDFMRDKVVSMIERHVPLLSETGVEHEHGRIDTKSDTGQNAGHDTKDEKAPAAHNMVLVSHVIIGSEDYQVGYRFDKDLTVGQLHNDVCTHWGCSRHEYVLCKVNADESVEPLWAQDASPEETEVKKATLLHDGSILNPEETAQLHMVRWEDVANFKEARLQLKWDQEHAIMQNPPTQQDDGGDPSTIKTLRHGLGYATHEKVAKPYVEALKPWPGFHHLIKTEGGMKWSLPQVRLSDFVGYGILIMLVTLSIGLRARNHAFAELRIGLEDTVGSGDLGPTPGFGAIAFSDIRFDEQVWAWFHGTLHHQVWDDSSALRRFYTPVGFLRIRQQRASSSSCPGERGIPPVTGACYHIEVGPDAQETLDLSLGQDGAEYGWSNYSDPDVWEPANENSGFLYGRLQNYDSSGYSVYYNLSEPLSSSDWARDVDFFKQVWIGPETRVVVAEFTVANFNLGGFVSANFLVEIAASGAISAVSELLPFSAYKSSLEDVAEGIDWLTLVCVVLFVGLLKSLTNMNALKASGRRGYMYFVSATGALNGAIVACAVVCRYIRMQGLPPDPATLAAFHSFRAEASDQLLAGFFEAALALGLFVRFSLLFRFSSTGSRLFHLFSRSSRMLAFFLVIFAPIAFAQVFLACTIWGPFLLGFSTWLRSSMTLLSALAQPFKDIDQMEASGQWWTGVVVLFMFFSTMVLVLGTMVAIPVHAWWEVDLLDAHEPGRWSTDEWLEWILWAPLYDRLTGNQSGGRRNSGSAGVEEEEEDTGSSSSSEGEQ